MNNDPDVCAYASQKDRAPRVTVYDLWVACICAVLYVLLGVSSVDAWYCIPGEQYLFPPGSDLVDWAGLLSAAAAPLVLLAAWLGNNRRVTVAASGLVLLAVLWGIRAVILLSYL